MPTAPMHRLSYALLGVFLFFSLAASAYVDYPQYGYDAGKSAQSALHASYDTDPPTRLSIPITSDFSAGFTMLPPVAGNVDDDKFMEFFLPYGQTLAGFEFRDGTITVEYPDLQTGPDVIPRNSAYVLHDVDGDGQLELFYCGTNSTHTVISGYRFNASTPSMLWQIAIGTPSPNNCHMQDDVTNTQNHTYPPIAYDYGGVPYLFFFVANESISDRGFDILKIDGRNGSYTSHNYFTNAACLNGIRAPGVTSGAAPRPWRSNQANMNGVSPYATAALCKEGAYDVLHVPVECVKTPPMTGRGILGVRIDTMQAFSWGTSGYTEMSSAATQNQFTSPICIGSTGARMIGSDIGEMGIWTITETGATQTDEVNTIGENHVWVSDMFYGEYNDPDVDDAFYDDTCFWGVTNTSSQAHIFCAEARNTFPLPENDVYAMYKHAITSFPPSPTVHTTTGTGILHAAYSLDSYTDTIMSMGFYDAAPSGGVSADEDFVGAGGSNEEFRFYTDLYGQMDGPCIGLDIDVDGYGDILCTSTNNITIFYTGYPNEPVDLRKISWDVDATMCPGNQSFFVLYDAEAGYADPEGDRVRLQVDCDSNGTTQYDSGYAAYGTSFTTKCLYETGSHTARITLRDEGTETPDTFTHVTSVSNITGCTDPDGLPSGSASDAGDVGSDGGSAATEDIADTFKSWFPEIGIVKQTTLEAVIIFVIIAIMAGFSFYYSDKSNIVMIVVIVGFMSVLGFTLLGFLRAYILILLVIFSIAAATIYNTMFGGGRQP